MSICNKSLRSLHLPSRRVQQYWSWQHEPDPYLSKPMSASTSIILVLTLPDIDYPKDTPNLFSREVVSAVQRVSIMHVMSLQVWWGINLWHKKALCSPVLQRRAVDGRREALGSGRQVQLWCYVFWTSLQKFSISSFSASSQVATFPSR